MKLSSSCIIHCVILWLAFSGPAALAQNWPQFRGPDAGGIASGRPTPTTWDVKKGEKLAWKQPVAGLAHSSPIIWGDRLFLTSVVRKKGEAKLSSLYGSPGYGAGESVADEGELEFVVQCLDKRSGEVLWKRVVHQGKPRVKRHPKSSHGNPTPVCNAERVIASFGSEGLFCLDHDGELKWKRDLGLLNSGAPGNKDKAGYQWGFASSPIIHGNRVFVQCDHEGASFVAALDLDTGKDVWRNMRDENSTWSSPTVYANSASGKPQLILNGYKHIGGYDLATGAEIWKLSGGGDVPVPTPVVAHGLVFLTSAHGRSRPIRAIKFDATGTLGADPEQEEHLAWVIRRRGVYMQTPLVHGELLYCCSDGGAVGCYDAKTGDMHYRERIGGGLTGFSGSPVANGDRLYFSGENGEVFVVKAGEDFVVLATNDMGEECMSTPAISDGTLYFRTRGHVVAIRE